MLSNSIYDELKVTCHLSKLLWFLKECAIPEAKKQKNMEMLKMYEALEKDLHKHIENFKKDMCLEE